MQQVKLYQHRGDQWSEWPTEWEHREGRPCPHDYTFNVRLGLDGELTYSCAQCGRYTVLSATVLKRMLRRRMQKQQEREREQE